MTKKILYFALLPFLTVLELIAKAMVWIGEHVVIRPHPLTKRELEFEMRRQALRGINPWHWHRL